MFRSKSPRHGSRRGTVLVLAACLMVALMGVLALAVDLGYIITVQNQLDRATDAAALAGAGELIDGAEGAQLQAFRFMSANPVGQQYLAENDQWILEVDDGWQARVSQLLADYQTQHDFDIQVGHWYPDRQPDPDNPGVDPRFEEDDWLPSTIRVCASYANSPLFFSKIFGQSGYQVTSEAIARYQPRDIALVLDFSGSMNDDSELKRIDWSGNNREQIEENMQQIYEELGSPAYGSLQFQPQYLTLVGQPPSAGNMPQITVTFRSSDVYVTSTKDLSNVVLQFSDGSTQKFEGLSGLTGTFRGTGGNYHKRIDTVWVKSGANGSGDCPGCGERFSDDYDTIKQAFGLDSIAYPYEEGSWNNYIYYAKTNGNVNRAGYRKKYGFMTLANYWLEQKPRYDQTSDLWKVSAQPIATVKDAVGVFMEYIQEVDTDDRAALVIYDFTQYSALIEKSLTEDFAEIEDIVQHRQAGHYDIWTNIGYGIKEAREELEANARSGAFKMIVLMTDGQANRGQNSSGTSAGEEWALYQADLTADKRIPIITISLGSGADKALMKEIADRTEGTHFNIASTADITDYYEDLLAAFRKIADDRPLVLVK